MNDALGRELILGARVAYVRRSNSSLSITERRVIGLDYDKGLVQLDGQRRAMTNPRNTVRIFWLEVQRTPT